MSHFGRSLRPRNPERPGGIAPIITTPTLPREMRRRMLAIRRFEDRASADYLAGKISRRHCYAGEAAVATRV